MIVEPQKPLRLDEAMTTLGLVSSRSHAARLIKLGRVQVDKKMALKPAQLVGRGSQIEIIGGEEYVSRAGFKLSSVAQKLKLEFAGQIVLDVGSSTGGFTDYALQQGAKKVIAVDAGTNQLHPSLRGNDRIELHEKTDIRDFKYGDHVDIALIDVSFISLREVLPSVAKFAKSGTQIVAMCKPQFEAGQNLKSKGVIKNDRLRRQILQDFETWLRQHQFVIINKADSQVAGEKGNVERFYLLKAAASIKQQVASDRTQES